MRSARVETSAMVFVCAAMLACASVAPASARDLADANDTGRRLNANTPSDVVLLKQLKAWPDGAARRLGDATVVAERAYFAASGQTCRALHLTPGQGGATIDRLACSEGQQWFFVPNVFGGGGATQ